MGLLLREARRKILSTAVRGTLLVGDLVTVRDAWEILQTLDEDGTLDGLPFMPEMLEFCGRTFRVSRKVEKTCNEADPGVFREFIQNDVFFLEELRCTGSEHGGCDRSCMIFWKEAWLRPTPNNRVNSEKRPVRSTVEGQQLSTTKGENRYFCQSTELRQASKPLSRSERLRKCFIDVLLGNYSLIEMVPKVLNPLWRKRRDRHLQYHPVGNLRRTPVTALGLQSADYVEVKPFSEILDTLDRQGRNRGLRCAFAIRKFCGRRFRVKKRMERMIVETTGEMKQIQNTVLLDEAKCQCYYAVGGCPRDDMFYFREIWLKKAPPEKSVERLVNLSAGSEGDQEGAEKLG